MAEPTREADPPGSEEHRKRRTGWRRLFRENWDRDIWLLGITIVVVVSLSNQGSTNEQFRKDFRARQAEQARESRERQDQLCVGFERQYAANVRQLAATYAYLKGLSPGELRAPSGINKAVLVGLPETETQATNSMPPAFCAERGVGLPEKFPTIPKRPKGLLPTG